MYDFPSGLTFKIVNHRSFELKHILDLIQIERFFKKIKRKEKEEEEQGARILNTDVSSALMLSVLDSLRS